MTRPAPVVYAASAQRKKWLLSDSTGMSVVSASNSKANGAHHFHSTIQQDSKARADQLAFELRRGFSAPDSLRPRNVNNRSAAVDLAGSEYIDRYARLPGGHVAARAAVAIAALKGARELQKCHDAREAVRNCKALQPRYSDAKVAKKRLSFSPHRRLTKPKSKQTAGSPLTISNGAKAVSFLPSTPVMADVKPSPDKTPQQQELMSPAMRAKQEREDKWFKETYKALAEECMSDGPLFETFGHLKTFSFTAPTSSLPSQLVLPIEALPFASNGSFRPTNELNRFPIIQDFDLLLSTSYSRPRPMGKSNTVIDLVGTPRFRSVPQKKLLSRQKCSIGKVQLTPEKTNGAPIIALDKDENVSTKSAANSQRSTQGIIEQKQEISIDILPVDNGGGIGSSGEKPVSTLPDDGSKGLETQKSTSNTVPDTDSSHVPDRKSSAGEGKNQVPDEKRRNSITGISPSVVCEEASQKVEPESNASNPQKEPEKEATCKEKSSDTDSALKTMALDFEMKVPEIATAAIESSLKTPKKSSSDLKPTDAKVTEELLDLKSPAVEAAEDSLDAKPSTLVTNVVSDENWVDRPFCIRPTAPPTNFKKLIKSLEEKQEEVEEASGATKKLEKPTTPYSKRPASGNQKYFTKAIADRKKALEIRSYDRRKRLARQLNSLAARKEISTDSGSLSISAGTKRALTQSAGVSSRPKRKSRTSKPIKDWTSDEDSVHGEPTAPPEQGSRSRQNVLRGNASGTTQTSRGTPSSGSKSERILPVKTSDSKLKKMKDRPTANSRRTSPSLPAAGSKRPFATESKEENPHNKKPALGWSNVKFSECLTQDAQDPFEDPDNDVAEAEANANPHYTALSVLLRIGSFAKKKDEYSCFKTPEIVDDTHLNSRLPRSVDPFGEDKEAGLPNMIDDTPAIKNWSAENTRGSKFAHSLDAEGRLSRRCIALASNRSQDFKIEDEPQIVPSDGGSEEANGDKSESRISLLKGAAENGADDVVNVPSDEESEEAEAKLLQSRVCGEMFKNLNDAAKDNVKRWALRDFSQFQNGTDIMEIILESSAVMCQRCTADSGGTSRGLCEESIVLKLWTDMTWRKIRRVRHVLGN